MRRFLIVIAVALVWPAAAQAFTQRDLRVTMSDGVVLAVTVYTPDGNAPSSGWPAVMAFHGLGQSRDTSNGIAERYLAPQGYAVLTVDARGHGESGGVSELDGPREVEDVRELLDWFVADEHVDPNRVGALGLSLGGGLVWRAVSVGAPFAAIVPTTTWTDLYTALFPGNLSKSGAVLAFLNELPADRFSPLITSLHDDLLHSTNLDRIRELARERSVAQFVDRITVPALVIQGRRDFEFDLAQARAAMGLGGPARFYLGDLGHPPAPNPSAELPHVFELVRAWFDRWLKGVPNGVDQGPKVELAPDPWTGRTFRYAGFPASRELRLVYPGRRTIGAGGKVVRTIRLPRRRLETFGAPVLRVSAATPTGWPRLVATLSALTPRGDVVVAAGGTQTSTLGRRFRQVTIRLTDQATLVPRGSRLRLTISTASDNLLYLPFPLPEGVKATIGRVRLALPVLRRTVSR